MFKPRSKPVQKHAKFCVGILVCCAWQAGTTFGELLDNTAVDEAVVAEDQRGYIWKSGLTQILEEAGVAVASPRSIDPKLRLHYYLAQCDLLIAEGNLEGADLKIQEALLDLTSMRGLLERQARVAGMGSNIDRANTYWASVVSHPGVTVENLADAAWSYLLTGQLGFGDLILEMGEKKAPEHPRLLLLRKLYQFKKGAKTDAVTLHAEDIPSLVYRITCRRKEIEALGGSGLFDNVCGWVLRGGDLESDASSEAPPVMMEEGTILYFSEKRDATKFKSDLSVSDRLVAGVKHLQSILIYERLEAWDDMLPGISALRKLGGMGFYIDLLEVKALGHSGRPMKSRQLAGRLLEVYPEQGALYFSWGRLLMDWGDFQEALGQFEKCAALGYKAEVVEAWLAACYTQLFNDPKAKEHMLAGLKPHLAFHFKKQISHEAPYWAALRRQVAQHEATIIQ